MLPAHRFIDQTSSPLLNCVLRARQVCAGLTVMCGLAALFAGLNAQETGGPGPLAAPIPTALYLVGFGVVLLSLDRHKPLNLLQSVVVGAILMMACWQMLSQEAGNLLGASVCVVFAVSLLLRSTYVRLAGYCMAAGATAALIGFVQVSFFGLPAWVPSSVLVGFVALTGTMLSLFLHRPFVRVALLTSGLGSATRIVAVTVLFLPWGTGWALDVLGGGAASGPLSVMVSICTCGALWVLLGASAWLERLAMAMGESGSETGLDRQTVVHPEVLSPRKMSDTLSKTWIHSRSTGARYGMIVLDGDYFRRIDATFGLGDDAAALDRLGQALRSHFRATDRVGRWSGQQFIILLPVNSHQDLDGMAHRLRLGLADPRRTFCAGLQMQPASLQIPLGIGFFQPGDDTPFDAIVRADQMLHATRDADAATVVMADLLDPQQDTFVFANAPSDPPQDGASGDPESDLNTEDEAAPDVRAA